MLFPKKKKKISYNNASQKDTQVIFVLAFETKASIQEKEKQNSSHTNTLDSMSLSRNIGITNTQKHFGVISPSFWSECHKEKAES